MNLNREQIDYLLSPRAIRERCQKVWELSLAGKTHFEIDQEKIVPCAEYVLDVINENYPDYDIPFHSRWGHFNAAGFNRLKVLDERLAALSGLDKARAKLDLVIVSVLLDAGAGMGWRYYDKSNDCSIGRSEGLAVASLDMFLRGEFSSLEAPEVDAEGLAKIDDAKIASAFQVTETNPLVGISGRTQLLNNLAQVMKDKPEFFPGGRPGAIVDYLVAKHGKSFKLSDVLNAVLLGLGSIWPGRLSAEGINLGDIWPYSLTDTDQEFENLVAFHKLSQWLTYSLVGPMEEAGLVIRDADQLTGLAEYRNGGLFVDLDVLKVRDPQDLLQAHRPDSEFIIEWRALTLCLLDQMGELIRNKLAKSASEFPLAKVLEGGTWHAGRKIAQAKREDGGPPIAIISDGTVF